MYGALRGARQEDLENEVFSAADKLQTQKFARRLPTTYTQYTNLIRTFYCLIYYLGMSGTSWTGSQTLV